MAPFQRDALAKRHQAAHPFGQGFVAKRERSELPLDPRDGQLLRGLVFGMPIGLAIWLLLALTVWKLA